MHRSGTSALAGLLARLGAQRPKREMPPQPDNPLGFFEPDEIVAIHDRFLAALGSDWSDWRKLPDDWRRSAAFATALDELDTAVHHDFAGDGTFLVKDPRTCRFVELWISLIERMQAELAVVHIFRTPLEVASSLRQRNGFDEARTHVLWLRHVLEAEVATRNQNRAFLSYEALLAGGVEEVERATRFVDLGLAPDAQTKADANCAIDPSQKRQHAHTSWRQETLGRWTDHALTMLECLRRAPFDRTAMRALDRLRFEFDAGCEEFGPMFAATAARSEAAARDVERLRGVEDERDTLVRALHTVTWAADRVPTLETELASAEARVAEMTAENGRLRDLERAIASERERLAAAERQAACVPGLEQQLAAARTESDALQTASRTDAAMLESTARERDGLRSELAARDAEMIAMRNALETLSATAERVPRLESDAAAARSEFAQEMQRHAAAKSVADADLAQAGLQLAEARTLCARLPDLERALAEEKARADRLARQLGSRKELLRRLFSAKA